MLPNDVANVAVAEGGHGELDLGPLAWVLDELRKSLDGAVKALRRFVYDAEIARESDLASLDAATLRMARQQLHQASGALEMVGMTAPALLLHAMENAVQRFVQRPELCTDDAAGAIERASFALSEYLEIVLAGKAVSPVALFPQYRDVQALTGAERVHPADLWPAERRFREPDFAILQAPVAYSPETRSRLDQAVLRIVKDGDFEAARDLTDLSLGLAAAQEDRQGRAFWKICAAFFDAFSRGMFVADVYVKRVASRVLMQYAALARGEDAIADRLVQDVLFFCAQARPSEGESLPLLAAVRQSFGLQRFQPVDYEARRFGRFDPAVLAQARKRIAAAAETWSALAGGDRNKLKPAADQFSLVCDSLRKLNRNSESLAQALTRTLDQTVRSAEPPSAALAMEVATSVLYLQAALDETDTADDQLVARAGHLAQRLDRVSAGKEPEPLESWMEDLYRRVSDHQTMGSVVDELRVTLGEAERSMDQFFRNPEDTAPLAAVPSRLAQMRGVLSVLGLDQASLAVLRMRDTVERLLIGDVVDPDERKALFERLGNSLGALGFMIDMLSYQRAMARKLFVYDEELGELRLIAGRARTRATDSAVDADDVAHKVEERAAVPLPDVVPRVDSRTPLAALSPEASPELPSVETAPVPTAEMSVEESLTPSDAVLAASSAEPAAAQIHVRGPEVEDELLEIFLEEAREVVENGLGAVSALQAAPGDLSEQTTLRRAFHTLKGSSRMVGLNNFGEAAWSMEQLLNAWLAEQKPMESPLLEISRQALDGFGRWALDIAAGDDSAWDVNAFRSVAEAMRLEGNVLPLVLPPARGSAEGLAEPVKQSGLDSAANEAIALSADVLPTADALAFPEVESVAQVETATELASSQISAEHLAPVLGDSVDAAETAQEPIPVVSGSDIDFAEFEAALEASDVESGERSGQPAALDATEREEDVVQFNEPALDLISVEQVDEPQSVERIELPLVADTDFSGEAAEPFPELPAEDLPQGDAASTDDNVKLIGDLSIGIPLYNVYLNEADEWSRRLTTCLQEWELELHECLPDTAVALAHSLAGSSATVGFDALSQTARLLEHALEHVQLQPMGEPEQAAVFLRAAEEVRRLLHQFAAGFLKEPDAQVLQDLREILEAEVSTTLSPSLPDMDAQAQARSEIEPAAQEPLVQDAAPEASEAHQGSAELSDWQEAEPVEALVPADVQPPVVGTVVPALSVPVRDREQQIDDAISRAMSLGSDLDDDIDALDVIDPDLFPIFEEEAAELLPHLGGALRQWAARPENLGARSEVLRALHTLKGSSRLAGAMRLGEMAHRLESAIEALDAEAVTSEEIEPLLGSFDALQANFRVLRAVDGELKDDAVEPLATASPSPSQTPEETEAPSSRVQSSILVRPLGAPKASAARAAAQHSVRVRAQLLDRLVNQAGEVMITRSRLESRLGLLKGSMGDLSINLDRLRQQLRDIEVQSESQMQSRLALSKDSAAGFDPLEFDRFTRVQELTRMMAESVNDVATVQRNLQRVVEGTEDDLIAQGRQARELQRDLLRTRMVEFEGIAERLYAVVRQSSKETGKQIKLDITGGSIEMDRGVLDRMTPAFEHLLRNCVAHGIELPDVRTAAGKPAMGTVSVALRHEGNDVSVEFRDDGAGLNLAAIRSRAVAQGIIALPSDASDEEAANLIFMPGFTTASEVTELSGRGIGMDVVRAEVQALGGRIETHSEAGAGAAFRMVLPLTTAVTQVVMLRAGELAFGVPANVVELVRRVPVADIEAAYKTGQFDVAGESVPFFWAGALLQASRRSQEGAGKTRPVVIFRSASQRIAMHVDDVLGNQEAVVKNLGPQLSRLPGLAGMSVLASGAVVLIYNPVALATVYGEQLRGLQESGVASEPSRGAAVPAAPVAPAGKVPLVLVVDDSITVRRVTQRLLLREGYRVALAADGLQALERLQEERPTVVLSDIEMPRMDGFDLARNIRADATLRDLPIVMITSRIAQKHRDHAIELGVNHYLGKPYSDEELLSLVRHYAQAVTDEAVSA